MTSTSIIYTLDESGIYGVVPRAVYSCTPKKALINYIMQTIKHNFNTWSYPENIDGIGESATAKDHWYYNYNGVCIASYPKQLN